MDGQQGQPGAGAQAGGDASGGAGLNTNAAAMLRLLAGLQRQQQQQQEMLQQQSAATLQPAPAGGAPVGTAGLGPSTAGGTLMSWAPHVAPVQLAQQTQLQQLQLQQLQQPDAASALLALLTGVQQQQQVPLPPPPPPPPLGGLAGLLVQLLPQLGPPLPPAPPQQADANLLLTLLQLLIQAGGGGGQQQAASPAFVPALPAMAPQLTALWQQAAAQPQSQPAVPAAGGDGERALEALRWLKQFEGAGHAPAPAVAAAPDPADCLVSTATVSDRSAFGVPHSGSTVEGDGKRQAPAPHSADVLPAKRQRPSMEQLIFGPVPTAPTMHPAGMRDQPSRVGAGAPAQPATRLPHLPAQQLQAQAQAPQAQLLAVLGQQEQQQQQQQQQEGQTGKQQHSLQQQPQQAQQEQQEEQRQAVAVPPQLEPQMAAAAATLAAAMAGQHSSPAAAQPLSGQVPLETLLAQASDSRHTLDVPALHGPLLAAVSPTAAGGHANQGARHNNQGYGVAVAAPDGLRRADMVALYREPQERVERQITNQTYILRLHVTTQMAQLLFPPRGELEAAHQAAVALDPPPPHASRLGGSSTYTQLFKQRLTIIDESSRAWPVQYEGFLSSGQRHYRLTSGWVGLMRTQQVGIGDTLVLERWTEDRWVIHLHIRRKAAATEASVTGAAAAAAATRHGPQETLPQVESPPAQQLQQDLLAQALAAVMQPRPAAATTRVVPPVILGTEGVQASAQASKLPGAAAAAQPGPEGEPAEAEVPPARSEQPAAPAGGDESVQSAAKQTGAQVGGSAAAADALPDQASGGGPAEEQEEQQQQLRGSC